MNKKIRFLPEAEDELRAAAEWYDDRAELGNDLAVEVRAATERIVESPESFAPARGVRGRAWERGKPR